MDKRELLEILNDWNFWKNELDTGKERQLYTERCLKLLKANVITAIIGVRRAGKSYIMRQVIKKLIEDIDKKNTLMVNFEDRRFAEFYPELLDEIYETYLEFLKPVKIPFVFLDEIHNMPKWEKWVRTMHELGKAKIIISGSSSKLLGGELATVITGRHLDINVFPLSFSELLNFKNIEIKEQLDIVANKINIKSLFNEYLEFGGFPEVVLSSNKKELLLTYFDDILTKDIERRFQLKKSEKLRAIARFYLTNISNPITFNSLKKSFGITTNTIEEYSTYLEESNIIFFIKRFSFKVKEQEKSPRKVYSIDIGLANAIGFRFSSNLGKIAENIVGIELKRKVALSPDIEIYYWKNPQHEEVDFVVKEVLKVRQLIQVCWDIDEYKTKDREIRALLKASNELKCKNLLIITEDTEGEEKINNRIVQYIPLWKWLLQSIPS